MLDNPFTCANGHSFRANAKLRARCPQCGLMTKRDFKAVEPEPEATKPEAVKTEPTKPEAKPVAKKPVLLKQGRPRAMPRKPPVVSKRTAKPPALVGGKVASGLVKSHKVKRPGTMPTIKGRPIKTAPARSVRAHGSSRTSRPFWHDVAEKYGI